MATPETVINRSDLQNYPSERLTDNDDGGGMPLSTPLTGAPNELFNPVTTFDRLSGDWSARLIYAGLQRPDAAAVYSAYFAITKPANDDAVSYLAMESDKFGESRKDIVKSVTSNLVVGDTGFSPALNKSHTQGGTELNIVFHQAGGEGGGFDVDSVIYLRGSYIVTINQIQKTQTYGEFAKITAVVPYEYEYYEPGSITPQTKPAAKITISRPLKNDYTKSYVLQVGGDAAAIASYKHEVFETREAGQARFYGVKPLATAVLKDAITVKLASICENIAPKVGDDVIDVEGIEVLRLPADGMTKIMQVDDEILITNSKKDDIGSAHTAGQTVQLSRIDVDRICINDADDKPVNAELWDYDLLLGTITWRTPLDLSSYKMPLSVSHAHEEMNRITAINDDGTVTLLFKTLRAYAIADTYVASVLSLGDLQVRVSVPFTQRAWSNVWQDTPIGDQLLNKLNVTDYPIVLTDDGAITERWMIKMTGTNQFELYGEQLGFVMRGDTLTDLAPIRPATGKPYFTLPKEAFGNEAPWANQDIIRINTWGTLVPVRIIRVVSPNRNESTEDGFNYCLYGDTTAIIA